MPHLSTRRSRRAQQQQLQLRPLEGLSGNDSLDSSGWSNSIEPSARRRVSLTSTQGGGGSSPDTSFGSPTSPTSPSVTGGLRIQHNPYRFNVLGVNASPDFASRTVPLPTYLAAAYSHACVSAPVSLSPLPPALCDTQLGLSPMAVPTTAEAAKPDPLTRRYVNGRPVPVRM